jgi:uncharacterized protein
MNGRFLTLVVLLVILTGTGAPLHCNEVLDAAGKGDLAKVKALGNKSYMSLSSKDALGKTPLIAASMNDRLEVVRYLVSRGVDVNTAENGGRTALYFAAQNNYKSIALFLISRGAEVNTQDSYGQTPLHRAAQMGHTEMVKLLVSSKADINAEDKKGKTPFKGALEFDKRDTAKALLDLGARGRLPLVKVDRTAMVVVLIVLNIPLYLLLGKIFFSTWDRFFEALKFWFKPDFVSWLDGSYWQDQWCEFVLFLFLFCCGMAVYGEYRGLLWFLMGE